MNAPERADIIKARVEHDDEAELDGIFDLSTACYVVFESENGDLPYSIVADMSEDDVEVYESQFDPEAYIVASLKP